MTGQLVLVSTPIGNLGDLSPRAVETLRGCALICCEDTRHSGKLLSHAGISGVRLAVANEHTEAARAEEVIDLLTRGVDVALITDAGTPGVSDPGARLVRAVLDAGHPVSAVPGPAALVMALVISGLDTNRFVFEGFLPRSGRDRTARLAEVAAERRTIVLYEAPHRLAATLGDLAGVLGSDRRVAVCRELTKLHEETWRGTLDEALRRCAEVEPRGEHVLVIDGAPRPAEVDDDVLRAALDAALAAGATRRDAAVAVAERHGVAPNRVKRLLAGG